MSTTSKHAVSEYSSNVCVRRLPFAAIIGVIVAFPHSRQATSSSVSVVCFVTMTSLCCNAGCTNFIPQSCFLSLCTSDTFCSVFQLQRAILCVPFHPKQFSVLVLMAVRRFAMLVSATSSPCVSGGTRVSRPSFSACVKDKPTPLRHVELAL